MERRNIPMQYGIHRSPSVANEGELSECINIEAHNGELTPSVIPEIAFTLQEGDKLLFVHKSGNYKNFIIQRGNLLCWFSDENKETVTEIGQISPTSIHSVGNTLVALSENEMEYILFKSGNYKRIGNKPPFCSISFSLRAAENSLSSLINALPYTSVKQANFVLNDIISQYDLFETGEIESLTFDLEEEYKGVEESTGELGPRLETINNAVNDMTEAFHAENNKIMEICRKKGYFYGSFFVRYAYKMQDGSHYMHSAPIFFPINTGGAYYETDGFFFDSGDRYKGDGIAGRITIHPNLLSYKIIGFYQNGEKVNTSEIYDWEDVIKGIDIYVTPQINRFNANSKVFGFSSVNEFIKGILFVGAEYNFIDEEWFNIYKTYTYDRVDYKGNCQFNMELKSDEEYINEIKNSSLFYKISSFDNIDILARESENGEINKLPIKENILENIQQQEKLDDDYDSHTQIIPSLAHVYNGRLNISGIRTKLFDGYPMESMVPYTYLKEGDNYTWAVRTTMQIDGKEIEVLSKSDIKLHEKPAFIYYPSTKANKFKVYMYNNFKDQSGMINMSAYSAEFKSEVHKLLNGSFYFSPTFGVEDVYQLDTTASNLLPSGDPCISYPNKIYTSEVNNPFFFPLSGRNSIGTGEIITISSNTKAISPGQFGQYPMIVFSTDGVWAMQVAGDGLFQSVHPISKDICVNPNVLQTNGPILFATDNGLFSVISESVEHISKIMKGAPDIIDIPKVSDEYTFLMDSAKSEMSFNTYIKDAIFAHDYINNRVVIYNPKMDFAYIYCMDCGMFAKMVIQKEGIPTRIESVVKAYPEVYMQSGADIYTFVHDRDDMATKPIKGIVVTRPMSFSDPLAMKVINDVKLIYRKRTNDTRCRYAMFVSNDGNNWSLRTSLRGRSFKYFRFAIYTEFADTDALGAMSVMFDYRRTNKLR